jgi:hypothetical protein
MRAAGTLLLVLLAATARAEEPANPPPDSIAAAKRDLAAIKSPVGRQDAGTLPSMDMKDLGPVPGAVQLEPLSVLNPEKDPSLDPSKKKSGTGNWLVDAMDKNTSTQASRSKEKDDVLKGDPDLIRADEKGVRLERDPLALDEAREKERPREAPGAVYNPLDSFMSGWISPRDHDLLLTPSKGEGLAGAEGGKTRADLLPGLEVGAPEPSADFTLAPIDSSSFGDSKTVANPYVAVMDLLPTSASRLLLNPEVPGLAPAEFEDLPRALSSPGLDSRPADAPRSFIPDFAQPDGDDKYFKQLKKF